MNVIAMIPARAGSVGLANKNIRTLNGIPLIAHTILCAQKSNSVSRVIVSTDSFEIAEIAKQYGAEVPFMRPSNLSTSETPMIDVAMHLIKELGNDISNNDAILTLQPTSPLRTPSDIDGSVALMTKQIAPAIVSVSECSDHPYLTYKIVNGEIHGFISHGIRHPRRQDLPIAYALNGAIFLNSVKSLMTDKEYRPHGSIAWVMPRDRSVDIDDLDDFNEAERIIKITLAKKETGQ
jgi:CMP-N,N'-diacetyllegionaminic acid synthase